MGTVRDMEAAALEMDRFERIPRGQRQPAGGKSVFAVRAMQRKNSLRAARRLKAARDGR